jgi:hypothetical protein
MYSKFHRFSDVVSDAQTELNAIKAEENKFIDYKVKRLGLKLEKQFKRKLKLSKPKNKMNESTLYR